jgi:hypothetical protein
VVVIGINLGESASGLLDFIKHYKIQHPILMDYQYQVHHEYQTYIWSHTIIIDRNMKITLRGHYPEKEIMEELDRLLKLQPSATATTNNLKKSAPANKSAAGALVCDDELGICYYQPAGKNIHVEKSQPPQMATGWTKAQTLTKDTGNNFDPRMARDSKGRVWITWYSDREGDNNIFAACYEGKKWSNQFHITQDKGDDYNPVIVADKKGGVWIAWVSNRKGNYDIYIKHFDGEKWSDAQPITTYFEDDMRPALTADSAGKLWAVWYTWEKMNSAFFPGTKISRDRNLYISYYDGSKWSDRQLISPPAEEDMSDDHADPALAIDGKGKIWFTWSCDYHPQRRKNPIKGADGPSIFSRYFDGQSWSEITAASTTEDEKKQSSTNFYPSMAVDKSGTIWLSYEGVQVIDNESDKANNNRIGFRSIFVNQVKNDSWQQPHALTNYEATNEEPCLIIDNKGRPQVFWYTDKDGAWNLYESNHTGNSWTTPAAVTIGKNSNLRPSACVDSEGRIWLAWYSKTGKNFDIFYASKAE